jgi:hypothetical protein
MGCTRNPSKISADCLALFAVLFTLVWPLLFPSHLWAGFASQFSFTTGEEYNDNIFLSKNREHDFITFFTPTVTLLYAPEGQVTPTLSAEISPSYQIYARNRDLNNFDNVSAKAGYLYQYSPRLSFRLSDIFYSQGETRTQYLFGQDQFLTGSTSTPPIESVAAPVSQNLTQLTPGKELTNLVSLQASFLYRSDIRFTGGYENQFTNFTDAGGSDIFHEVHAGGIYNWKQDHNLHAGYRVSIYNLHNGDSGVIHNFDFGDDYFTNYKLQVTPTLSLAVSTGLSVNTGNSGPGVANNTSITITKLWETAQVNGGVRKGLTPSYGVSGISDTTSFFTYLNWQLTEKLWTNSFAVFSLFDTSDVNFKTFQAGLGVQYLFTSWLSTGLNYRFGWIDSGSGATKTDLLQKGIVKQNIAFLSLTTRFDVWPNIALARGMTSPTLTPVLTPPFSVRPSQASPSP